MGSGFISNPRQLWKRPRFLPLLGPAYWVSVGTQSAPGQMPVSTGNTPTPGGRIWGDSPSHGGPALPRGVRHCGPAARVLSPPPGQAVGRRPSRCDPTGTRDESGEAVGEPGG